MYTSNNENSHNNTTLPKLPHKLSHTNKSPLLSDNDNVDTNIIISPNKQQYSFISLDFDHNADNHLITVDILSLKLWQK